jgi:hypothetical protein
VNVDPMLRVELVVFGRFARFVVLVPVGVRVRVVADDDAVLDELSDVLVTDEVGSIWGDSPLPQPTSADTPSSALSTNTLLPRIATPRPSVSTYSTDYCCRMTAIGVCRSYTAGRVRQEASA